MERAEPQCTSEGHDGVPGRSRRPSTSPHIAVREAVIRVVKLCGGIHLGAALFWKVLALSNARFGKLYESLSWADRLFLAEKVVSTLHGVASFGMGYTTVLADGDFDGDVVNSFPLVAQSALAMNIGYGIYDSFIMLLQGSTDPVMWMHHILMITGASLSLHYKKMIFYPTTYTMTELTVLPANLLWHLKTLMSDHVLLQRLTELLRLLFFVALRVPPLPFVLWFSLKKRSKLHRCMEAGVPKEVPILNGLFCVVFGLMNMFWTFKMGSNIRARIEGTVTPSAYL